MRTTLRSLIARARETFVRTRLSAEQDEEFRFHLDMQIEHNRRLGMSEHEARRAATIAFGGRERFREETRDARGFVNVDNALRDARFALRRLRRAPAFAGGALLTLGIGIGAAVGIGGIVYGVLFRELPYENADRVVRVSFLTPGLPGGSDLHSEASYVHLATVSRSFERFGAYYVNAGVNISDGDEAERVTAGMVSPGAFRLLGVRPLLGQLFADADTNWNTSASPILISQELWERRYGSDPNIIGRSIEINLGARRVIGVLPRSFDFPQPDVKIWYPLALAIRNPSLTDRYYNVVALLKPGVSIAAASAELNTLVPTLSARFPTITAQDVARSAPHVEVESLKSALVAPVRGQLVLLGIMVAVVLLIATTNVVNLFLLRAESASHEIAISLSLGAGRAEIAQRWIVEGIVVGLASLVVAVPVAALAISTKLGFTGREIPRLHEVSFDLPMVAAVLAMAIVVGATIGLAALTRSNGRQLADRLRGAGRATASAAWRRVQQSLVVTQVAIALALLVAAGLLGRSFWNLRNAKLGFSPTNATTFEVSLPFRGYVNYAEAAPFHARVVDGLRALPGVSDATVASHVPLTPREVTDFQLRLVPDGAIAEQVVAVTANLAAPDYFRVMSIPVTRGRSFAQGDLRGDAAAIVLSASIARAMFGSDNPVGRRVHRAPDVGVKPVAFQVVGVVGDVPGARIEDGAAPLVYLPLLRDGDGLPADARPLPFVPRSAQYVVRGTVLPSAATLRTLIRELDRRVPAVGIQPVSALVDVATARVRLTLMLLVVAGGAALLLGVIGVYSVVSYAAAGRLREFGVRLALGATPARVASMVFHDGVVVALLGVVVGLFVAWSGTRFLTSLLFEVSPTSAGEFVAAAGVLALVTLAATLIPARRASRTDPAVVLRGE